MKTEDIIYICIAIVCFSWVAIPELISLYKLFFGKNITFINKNGEKLTVPRKYDKDTLNKISKFLNKK